MSSRAGNTVTVRRATPEDAEACGRICYDAFRTINAEHNFPCDFTGPEMAVGLLAMMFGSPGHYCVVAESDGRVLGSNALYEGAVIAGVGPVSIDPAVQNRGVGRMLMQAVMDRAAERGAAGVRLVQAAFHNRSLSLYSSMGFDVREPLTCLQGTARERTVAGCSVRKAAAEDAAACNALSRRVHGFDRAGELEHGIAQGSARVLERGGRITGYTSVLGFFGHATAETNVDLQALIAAAESFAGPGILLPMRNAELFRWCLGNGLRVVQPMTLMSLGLYNEPAGAWLPSVIY
jgi:GNAT superfamily N-acetyltransferase